MEYGGYSIMETRDGVVVKEVSDFHPVHTFECGQCFRWKRRPDGSYLLIARERVIEIRYDSGRLELRNSTAEDFIAIWYDYLDLGRDYAKIKEAVSRDEIMRKAVAFGHGIRLLRQDLWETLISFIISSNNNIPRIMRIIEALSSAFGRELSYDGKVYHAFPEAQRLGEAEIDQVAVCRGGYRCRYIANTARMVREKEVDISRLGQLDTPSARNLLLQFPGVGNKVADCTLLYSGTHWDVFPTDVWVKRVMEELYFGRETSLQEIQQFAAQYFGEYAGFAQQYLFYYAREHKIGMV